MHKSAKAVRSSSGKFNGSASKRLASIKAAVLSFGDPWELFGRTRLWDDGSYSGDGRDLILCRDIVHDLYVLWSAGNSGQSSNKKGTK